MMKLKSSCAVAAIALLVGGGLSLLEDETPDVIPENYTGDVKITCYHKGNDNQPKYLLSARAEFQKGAMEKWTVTQRTPYMLAVDRKLDDLTFRMSVAESHLNKEIHVSKESHVSKVGSGYEISVGSQFNHANNLYLTDDMSNLYYSYVSGAHFSATCIPKIA